MLLSAQRRLKQLTHFPINSVNIKKWPGKWEPIKKLAWEPIKK